VSANSASASEVTTLWRYTNLFIIFSPSTQSRMQKKQLLLFIKRPVVGRLRPQFVNRFLPNFAHGSEMWLVRRLVFLEESESRYLMSEVCEFRVRQFSGSGHQVLQRIGPNCRTVRIKQC